MFKNKYWYIVLILVPIILTNCAKRGTITGGPKDTLAPVMTSSFPENNSKNFKGNKIVINFDEYVKIKDANKQIIVSPPLKNKPSIMPQGGTSKSITISFNDTLQANTTYSINFGQSIIDNNEGNPYSQFKYVFSTGNTIDSLKLKGQIRDALSQKTDEFVSVMLYDAQKFTDSTIYKEVPMYVTNTLQNGNDFEINNIKEGKYYLIALKDENTNNKFDSNTDKIGFYPEIISIPNDTLYNLNLFKEKQGFKTKKPVQISNNKINFGVSSANYEKFDVEAFLNNSKIDTRITRISEKDSIQLWLPKLDIKNDSLQINIKNNNEVVTQKIKLKSMKAIDTLALNLPKSLNLDFRDNFNFTSNTPIENIDKNKITLIKKDSTNLNFNLNLEKLENRVAFDFEKQENESYTLTLLPGAVSDFYGKQNDTLKTVIATKSYSDYGNLKFSISNVKTFPIIVQLLDEKENVIYKEYSTGNTEFSFESILPKKYLIRIIYDMDENKEWTPGNYLLKKQPEEIYYFNSLIDVRANWDVIQPTINLQE